MVEKIKEENGCKTVLREFKSLEEFYNYITTTEYNKYFKNSMRSSEDDNYKFRGTKSFEEAVELLKNGWEDMSEELNTRIKVKKKSVGSVNRRRNIYDVVGYNPSVPRYLQGIPTNMVRSVNVPVKEKVVTITKSNAYSCAVRKEKIIDESVKVLNVINRLELQGIRCNLNIINCFYNLRLDHCESVKIRIKGANERLNLSKLSFPLAHPSMLRRLLFRYLEVSPTLVEGYNPGYGVSHVNRNVCKGEYLFESFINGDLKDLKDLDKFCIK